MPENRSFCTNVNQTTIVYRCRKNIMWASRTVPETAKGDAVMRGPAAGMAPAANVRDLAASPRILEVGAPGRRSFIGGRSIGAAVHSPRVDSLMPVLEGTDAVVFSLRMANLCIGMMREPRGMSKSLGRRGPRNAALGQCSMNGVVYDRRLRIKTQEPEEGVLCSRIGIGIDARHDDVFMAPGAPRACLPGSARARCLG